MREVAVVKEIKDCTYLTQTKDEKKAVVEINFRTLITKMFLHD